MCSIGGPASARDAAGADLAARLSRAIDELAGSAGQDDDHAWPDLAQRLAKAWSMITDADPELAARTARYSPAENGNEAARGLRPNASPGATGQP